MSYYEPQGWQAPVRQASWEQPAPPSRSGTSSASQREETTAFSSQFDEVDRAVDNLVKSGKLFNNNASRRDSVPMMMGRPYPEYDPRGMGAGPQRHHSISEYDPARSHSTSNVQGFYASQRYQSRPSEAEQMMQAKRRMAAQRERELRNYHQEQQYNRSLLSEMSGNKSDRSMSPAAMSEESRRELIARQHRALYGNESPAFYPNGSVPEDGQNRPESQSSNIPTSVPGGTRGQSPRGVDPFGLGQNQGQGSSDGTVPVTSGPSPAVPQSPSRANSTSSPVSGNNQSFGGFDGSQSQQQTQTSTSSPGGAESPSSLPNSKSATGPIGTGVGPIGSRPSQQPGTSQASNPALTKRSTTPLPSPLSYGFAPNEAASNSSANPGSNGNNQPAPSSNPSNATPTTTGGPNPGAKESSGGVALGWGNGSGVWGSKNPLGVQASVWG